MNKYIIAIVLCCSITSCIKDEAQNQECDIESAWIEGQEYEKNFYQIAEMRKDNISSAETNITFTVRSLISLPTQIPVKFKITDGATIEPANGSMQDFTEGPITYTVTSEDGQWKRTYKVAFSEPVLSKSKFSFENVDTLKGGLFKENYYHVFYDFDQNGEKQMFWATGNAGFALSQLDNSGPDQFPSYRADNGFNGKCACLQTLSTGVFGQAMHKPIAAGNLFLGKFIVEYAASESLKATAFGLPWDKEPVRVTGYYKYKPGKEVINYMEEVIPDRTDEASAYAVFYRNLDEKGEKYTLDGEAVSELDKLMDNPQVYKVARVPALPPTDQWRHFEMFFKGKDAPDDMVAKKEFSLAKRYDFNEKEYNHHRNNDAGLRNGRQCEGWCTRQLATQSTCGLQHWRHCPHPDARDHPQYRQLHADSIVYGRCRCPLAALSEMGHFSWCAFRE